MAAEGQLAAWPLIHMMEDRNIDRCIMAGILTVCTAACHFFQIIRYIMCKKEYCIQMYSPLVQLWKDQYCCQSELCIPWIPRKYCTHPEDVLSYSELVMPYRIPNRALCMLNSPRKNVSWNIPSSHFSYYSISLLSMAWWDTNYAGSPKHQTINFASTFKPLKKLVSLQKGFGYFNHVLVTSVAFPICVHNTSSSRSAYNLNRSFPV